MIEVHVAWPGCGVQRRGDGTSFCAALARKWRASVVVAVPLAVAGAAGQVMFRVGNTVARAKRLASTTPPPPPRRYDDHEAGGWSGGAVVAAAPTRQKQNYSPPPFSVPLLSV